MELLDGFEEVSEVFSLAILQRLEARYNSHSDSVLMHKHAESCLGRRFPNHQYSSPFSSGDLTEQLREQKRPAEF